MLTKRKVVNFVLIGGIIFHAIYFLMTTKTHYWYRYPMNSFSSVYPILLIIILVEWNIQLYRKEIKTKQDYSEKQMSLKKLDRLENTFFVLMFLYATDAFMQIMKIYEAAS